MPGADRSFHLFLRTPGEKRRPPRGVGAVVHLDGAAAAGYHLHHRLDRLPAISALPNREIHGFLVLALGVWAADKLNPRAVAPDAWTRKLVLHLPATDTWEAAAPRLSNLLTFLTGDDWGIKTRPTSVDLGIAGHWPHPWQPEAVALFSGGLDSLAGAIDLLEEGKRLLLVSHYDFGQLAATQQNLVTRLENYYGSGRLHHLPLRVQLEGPELTLRSRSLLYLALGLTAAAAFAPDLPLYIPENAWISLNPPLTLNRLGTYTTRTTHPEFLKGLRALWEEVGIGHPLRNPYKGVVKGEMLAGSRNRALLRKLAPRSISCARPVVARWQGEAIGHCGYCYPCLLRRVAMHRLGWDDGAAYRWDVAADPGMLTRRVQGRDLRALLLALRTWARTPGDILPRLFLGQPAGDWEDRFKRYREVLDSGFAEIHRFFQDRCPAVLKEYLEGGG